MKYISYKALIFNELRLFLRLYIALYGFISPHIVLISMYPSVYPFIFIETAGIQENEKGRYKTPSII